MHSLNVKQFYKTLSGATTLDQSGPGSDGNEGGTPHSLKLQYYWILFHRSDCLMSDLGHLLGESYPLGRDTVNAALVN